MADNERLNLTPPPKRQFEQGGLAEDTPVRPKQRPRLDLTKEDILAIERMVWAEGRGESPEGRDAIRSVILNRIASDRFDNSVKEVLERSDTRIDDSGREVTTYQFQPIGAYGSVDNIPAPETDLDQQYFEFLDFIERGEDASGGRSFFQNTEKAEDRYVGVDPMIIGNHTFYKGLEGQEPVTDINFSHNVRLVGDDIGMSEGGLAMEEQMSAILKEEGGLTDDGMDRDPVSGNEVPPGSLAEEVRDDVDARLSGGEYVVPADVVRYYGVKFFEDLRGEAKEGLNTMEATGRIGGEPVPVDSPVQAASGGYIPGYSPGGLNLLDNSMVNAATKSIASNLTSGMTATGDQKQQQPDLTSPFYFNPTATQNANPSLEGIYNEDGTINYDKLPSEAAKNMYLQTPYNSLADLFSDFAEVGNFTQKMRERNAGMASAPGITYVSYTGPNGEIIMVPFMNGEPMVDIPDGFKQSTSTTAKTSTSTSTQEQKKPEETFEPSGDVAPTGMESQSTATIAGQLESVQQGTGLAGTLSKALDKSILGRITEALTGKSLSQHNIEAMQAELAARFDTEEGKQAFKDIVAEMEEEGTINPNSAAFDVAVTGGLDRSFFSSDESFNDAMSAIGAQKGMSFDPNASATVTDPVTGKTVDVKGTYSRTGTGGGDGGFQGVGETVGDVSRGGEGMGPASDAANAASTPGAVSAAQQGIAAGLSARGMDPDDTGGTGGEGGTKVICTALHNKGLLDSKIYELDEAYGQMIRMTNPALMDGYHKLAVPFANYIQKDTLGAVAARYAVAPFARAWANEMAHVMKPEEYKGSILGKAIMSVTYPVCEWVGKKKQEKLNAV